MTTTGGDMPRTGEPEELKTGAHFTAVRLGEMGGFGRYSFEHPVRKTTTRGKVFLKQLLGLTGLEMSWGVAPPGGGTPFQHKHTENEEVYVFVSGKGQMQVDGEVIEVGEGSAVRIAPDGARAWRNTGTGNLVYLCIQAREGSLRQWTVTDGVPVTDPPVWPGRDAA